MSKRKKILIIGGNGFVGSWLADFLKASCHVAIFDLPHSLRRDNDADGCVKKILALRKQLVRETAQYAGDGTSYPHIATVMNTEKPDVVVCMASIPLENFHDRRRQIETDVMHTMNVLVANKHIGARIVFTSSILALGDFTGATSEHIPLMPTTAYGVGKATAEYLVQTLAPHYGIVRVTPIYGFGDLHPRAAKIFFEKSLTGGSFFVNTSTRMDFIYIKDVIAGIAKVIFSKHNGIFNISTGRSYTLSDFIAILESTLNIKLNYTMEYKNDRPQRGTLINDKARTILGWKPCYTLQNGIAEVIDYYRDHRLYS